MIKYTSFSDRIFTCLHNSSLRLNRHVFLIPLRWRIRQILLVLSFLMFVHLMFSRKTLSLFSNENCGPCFAGSVTWTLCCSGCKAVLSVNALQFIHLSFLPKSFGLKTKQYSINSDLACNHCAFVFMYARVFIPQLCATKLFPRWSFS